LLGACLLLTACGGGSADGGEVASVGDGDGAESTAEEDTVKQAQEFAECLRDNGVEIEDPDPETGKLNLQDLAANGDRAALSEAMDACNELAPQSLQDAAEGDLTEEQQEGMQQFAECMRNEGIDVPDPGPEGLDPSSLDLNDPATEAALEVCQGEMGWRQ
jgi:hypothetical protein